MLFVHSHLEVVRPLGRANRRQTKAEVLTRLEELTGCPADPDYISDQGTDLCVRCGEDSGVSSLEHVENRSFYVDGVGQHCHDCFDKK